MSEKNDQAHASAAPEGYSTVSPWVITDDTRAFIDFAHQVFGATERFPAMYDDAGRRILHAEVQVGDSVLLLFDRDDGWAPTPAFLNVYVDDCDAVHQRALEAGATEVTPLSTNAWGQRGSRLRDPFGNLWWVQTHVEDVSEEEMAERMGQQRYLDDLAVALNTLDIEMKNRSAS